MSKHVGIACFFILLPALLVSSGCGSANTSDNNANSDSDANANFAVKPEVDELKRELTALRNADFDYIYSFKRIDGEPMDTADKRFVKDNSHWATNRFTLTGDERVIFAGSNYKFPDDGLKALAERFELEDFSKPEDVIEQKRLKKLEEREAKNKEDKGNSAGNQNQK